MNYHPANHYYGDVSNLNAPYDAIAIQGVGNVTFEGKTLHARGFPWREESHDTLLLQARLNGELQSRGYCPLLLDGIMGPRTCGALYTLEDVRVPDEAVATCSLHVDEAIGPKQCPGGVAPAAPAPDTEEEDAVKTPRKTGGIPVWVWGVGLGVVAIGAAMMLKKKRR